MIRPFSLLLFFVVGCSDAIVVTVEVRPAVHDVARLRVTLSGEGPPVIEDFAVDDDIFPKTFSIGPEDRSGDLLIAVDAFDPSDTRVGLGSVTTPIDSPSAALMLEPADFIVNTDYVGDQQLLQLAATTDGTWTVLYTSQKGAPDYALDVSRRRYDARGRSVTSDDPLPLPQLLSTSTMAATSTAALVIREETTEQKVKTWCECFDADGATTLFLREGAPTSLAKVASRPDNTFVVIWLTKPEDDSITTLHAGIVDSKCNFVGGNSPAIITTSFPFSSAHNVITRGEDLLYMWDDRDGTIHIRTARQIGTAPQVLNGEDATVIPPLPDGGLTSPSPVVLDDGFGIVIQQFINDSLLNTLLYRVSNVATLTAPPVELPVDWTIRSLQAVPNRAGTLFVVGETCSAGFCKVLARFLSSTGDPISDTFPLATTTAGTQTGATITPLSDGVMATAWNDQSLDEPDRSGFSVRARIIYPPGTP